MPCDVCVVARTKRIPRKRSWIEREREKNKDDRWFLPVQLRQRLQLLRREIDVVGVLCHFSHSRGTTFTAACPRKRRSWRPDVSEKPDLRRRPSSARASRSRGTVTSSRRVEDIDGVTAATTTITARTDSNPSYTTVTANVRRPNAPERGRTLAERDTRDAHACGEKNNGAKHLNKGNHFYVHRIYRLNKKKKRNIYIMFNLNTSIYSWLGCFNCEIKFHIII